MNTVRGLLALAVMAGTQMAYADTQSSDADVTTPTTTAPNIPGPPGASPTCLAYDRYLTRAEAVLIQTSNCDTLSPELFGLRSTLADNGFGFSANFHLTYEYDLLGHNATPQLYMGQNPTYGQSGQLKLTYDMTRLGMGGGAQLTVGSSWGTSNYQAGTPNFFSFDTLAINQRFLGGQLEIQYGYYDLIRSYYGMVLGGNSSAAAFGPISVIPVELGLSLFTPTPAFMAVVRDGTGRWYNRASIARSASPQGFQYDVDQNPSGLRFTVPGSRAVFVDEFGYQTQPSPGNRAFWARAGAIYNTSSFENLQTGGTTSNNYGGYVAVTAQLTQPYGGGPGGLYIDAKADYAPQDRNLFSKDFQLTMFYLGPFASRPQDMASIGFSTSYFSKYPRESLQAFGVEAERKSTALSLSYAAHVARGVYWVSGLTWQQGPTFAPAQPDALLLQTSLNFSI